MSKIRNTAISSLYLAQLVNAQHNRLKKNAAVLYGHIYIIWSYEEAKIKSSIDHFIIFSF